MQIKLAYEPQFYHQAVRFAKWRKTMAEELIALKNNKAWSIVPLPNGKKLLGKMDIQDQVS